MIRRLGCVLLSALAWTTVAQGRQQVSSGDPAARRLYDGMIQALRDAKSLSWTCDYVFKSGQTTIAHSTYKAWLRKPNYARVEAARFENPKAGGTLVLDGERLFVYWPNGKPRYPWENSGKFAQDYEHSRLVYYTQKPAANGRHSIGHEVMSLGAGMGMTVLDPSTFHGYTDSLQPYIDYVAGAGMESIGGDECDVIDVSYMKGQRLWRVWIAKRDRVPRKLNETVRVNQEVTITEVWSHVVVNGEIPKARFAWSPPKGWKEWTQPPIEAGLLKPGTPAPDFALTSIDGRTLRLSSSKGKIVWLNFWRCG